MVLRRLQSIKTFDPNSKKVLVVEPAAPDGGGISRALKGFGARRLATADSAENALELFLRQQFEIAIFEYALPRLSGLDLLQIVVQEWPETRVILTTGPRETRIAEAALAAGAFACVSRDELLNAGLVSVMEAAAQASPEDDSAPGVALPDALADLIAESRAEIEQLRLWVAAQHNTSYRLPSGDALHRQWLHSAFEHYMAASMQSFPGVAEQQQESLVTLILNYGCSPLELVQAMQASLDGLVRSAELPAGFRPSLALMQLMLRVLQGYQTQMAVESLQRQAEGA